MGLVKRKIFIKQYLKHIDGVIKKSKGGSNGN